MPSLHRGPEFVDRQVFFDIKKRFEYPVALMAMLETLAGAVLLEHPSFAHKSLVFEIDIHFQDHPFINIPYFINIVNTLDKPGKRIFNIDRDSLCRNSQL